MKNIDTKINRTYRFNNGEYSYIFKIYAQNDKYYFVIAEDQLFKIKKSEIENKQKFLRLM